MFVFFFKQKTAYEMRISDWSSDVCSSDLKVSYKMATYRFDYGPDFKKLAALTKLDSNANIDSVVSASTNLPMTYWYKNSWITSTKNIDDQSTDFRTAFDKKIGREHV